MRWPWIARTSHDETVKLLQEQIAEMRAERKVIYDRLALLGLGGPLFHLPTPEEVKAEQEEENEKEEAAAQELARLKAMRPSQRAAFITRKNQRDFRSIGRAAAAWVPPTPEAAKVAMEIDQAEKLGERLA
jgi:hypothetical protein